MEKILKLLDSLYLIFPWTVGEIRLNGHDSIDVGVYEFTHERFLAEDWSNSRALRSLNPKPPMANEILIRELFTAHKTIENMGKKEICSSIRYESTLIAGGYKSAIADLCALTNSQNPFQLVNCRMCKKGGFIFADLENTCGICPTCGGH